MEEGDVMEARVRGGRLRRVATASAGLLVALTGCTTRKPPAAALDCAGAAAVDVPAARTGLPPRAAPGLRERPRSVAALPGGPSLVLPGAGGGAPRVYRVDPEGDLVSGRLEGDGVARRWRTPLGAAFRPAEALVTLSTPAGDDGPLLAAAHHQHGKDRRSEFRLLSGAGEEMLRCTWRPYDAAEHVELSADGRVLVATRTTKKPRVNGSSAVADRHVEIFSTATGERLVRARATDHARDGARVYGRLGSEVFAYEAGSGREVWRTDTGTSLGDPRKGVSEPLFPAGDLLLVQAADGTVTALDTATGERLWRGGLPGRVQSVHPLGEGRTLVHHRGGLAFTGPRGIERTRPVPAAADGARQKLEHVVRAADGVMAAVVEDDDRSGRVLTVWGDTPALADAPLRITLPAPHVQAVLTDTVAHVLPWVPDGEQATLYAYDLTAGGRALWRADVPSRLHIEDSPGPDASLHPYAGGLLGLDRSAAGWVLRPGT
ncbi:PQQ-binding-like beta-propeller repeat protein [Streptomyces sp. NPDC005931]|uniref:outer membrane protein assembly factor BamB family protein n=1 Tax=Streptomyces sp. NPDC005931 TaxID=3364737 RepID=UPI0036BDB355